MQVGQLKNADCNAKVTKIEDKIPSINGLGTNDALNTVANKIPKVNDLVQKHIMIQKYQTLRLNISLNLIIICLHVKHELPR